MGYMHINNLYKDQLVLIFKMLFALEKIHGTSAHLRWKDGKIIPFSGGASHDHFLAIFDGNLAPTLETLEAKFNELFGTDFPVTVYGEAYGGKMQGMRETYGDILRFIAFDVQVGDVWVSVPKAENIAAKLGLEFVHYQLVPAELEALNAERDAPSVQAIRNGCGMDKKREGVVLRPVEEMTGNNGARIIAKHKREDFEERKTKQKVVDPAQLKVYEEANAAAEEFVTDMRLTHVMDKVFAGGEVPDISKTGDVIKAMLEDVLREAEGEIVDSKELRKAISSLTGKMFKKRVTAVE